VLGNVQLFWCIFSSPGLRMISGHPSSKVNLRHSNTLPASTTTTTTTVLLRDQIPCQK
jgi:hypothetical protein